ncbi:MAG: VanZ family protein [Ginsengibacter sp.]
MKFFKFGYSSAYFLLLNYLVFFARRRRNHHFNYEINFVPIKYSIHTFLTLNANDNFEVYNFYLNLFGNILLFLPFGIILITVFNVHKLKWIILSTIILSSCIEVLQYLFQVGLADIDDVVLNLSGAVLGFYLYKKIIQVKFVQGLRKQIKNKEKASLYKT